MSEDINFRIHKQAHFEFIVFTDVTKLNVDIVDTGLKFDSEQAGQTFEKGQQYKLTINDVCLFWS